MTLRVVGDAPHAPAAPTSTTEDFIAAVEHRVLVHEITTMAADYRAGYATRAPTNTGWMAMLTGRVGVAAEHLVQHEVSGGRERDRKAARRALLNVAALCLVMVEQLTDQGEAGE